MNHVVVILSYFSAPISSSFHPDCRHRHQHCPCRKFIESKQKYPNDLCDCLHQNTLKQTCTGNRPKTFNEKQKASDLIADGSNASNGNKINLKHPSDVATCER